MILLPVSMGEPRLRQGLVGAWPYLPGNIQTEEQQWACGPGWDLLCPQAALVGSRASALTLAQCFSRRA